jgi:DHA1 family inner membrane transport protein
MPGNKEKVAESQLYVLKDPKLWLNLVSTVLTLAAMFSSYSYLAAYLEKISQMDGAQISIMLLLFGSMGIAGNWLMGMALGKNVILASRAFFYAIDRGAIIGLLFWRRFYTHGYYCFFLGDDTHRRLFGP